MIILCGNEKGGVGKTTIAVNLATWYAASGLDVCIVDTDVQGSATAWQRHRQAGEITPTVTVCNMNGRMGQDLIAMSKRFDIVIVDAGGRDAIEIRQAALVADLWLIPMSATHVEMWALNTALALCQSIEDQIGKAPRTAVVINKVHTLPTVQDSNELADAISSNEQLAKYTPVCPVRLCDRLSFQRSFGAGQGVIEYEPKGKAAAEIYDLTAWINEEFK